jgi:hypothetical protein
MNQGWMRLVLASMADSVANCLTLEAACACVVWQRYQKENFQMTAFYAGRQQIGVGARSRAKPRFGAQI